jgi:hypothetical protein
MVDLTTYNTRITVQTAGIYLVAVGWILQWAGTVTNREVQLTQTTSGGSETLIAAFYGDWSATGTFGSGTIIQVVSASVGDYFRARVQAATGGSGVQLNNDARSYLAATWIGKTA